MNNIFLVNLAHRTDRLQLAKEEFAKAGIDNWTRFEAVKYNPNIHGFYQEFLTYCSIPKIRNTLQYFNGSFGCLLSHYNIIKMAKEQNWPSVTIFEDDLIFIGGWREHFNGCMAELTNLDWQMFYFSANHETQPIPVSEYLVRPTRAYTTTGYIIKSELYETVLENLPKWDKEIDVFYADVIQKCFNVYCSSKSLIGQRPSYSDILGQVVFYNL